MAGQAGSPLGQSSVATCPVLGARCLYPRTRLLPEITACRCKAGLASPMLPRSWQQRLVRDQTTSISQGLQGPSSSAPLAGPAPQSHPPLSPYTDAVLSQARPRSQVPCTQQGVWPAQQKISPSSTRSDTTDMLQAVALIGGVERRLERQLVSSAERRWGGPNQYLLSPHPSL